MFDKCRSLKEINALKNWNALNGDSFLGMFGNCDKLYDRRVIMYWTIKDDEDHDAINMCYDF